MIAFKVFLLVVAVVLTNRADADWFVAPNQGNPDRPAYWVADVNGVRVESILNDYRIDVGRPCLGNEVRTAGNYSLRWLDVGPNPLAGICDWVGDEPTPPDPVGMVDLLITWAHNGLRTDGTPVTLTGFSIHGTRDGQPIEPVFIDDPTARRYEWTAPPGHYCFEVVAREGDNTSAPSSPPVCRSL